ncbi:Ligand-gated ion channel [Ancylostoma ceylanicum]|uniref:Ligand-gated ion channel n=1 Tax=Ancylostoma ceylanicum TaxID=53326 RepID=A0A0D6LR24_9BILA|nr:Ligand-gated ion channel [Ancylostoma ceylanicum]
MSITPFASFELKTAVDIVNLILKKYVATAYWEIFETTSTQLANYTVVAEYIDGGVLRKKPFNSANRLQLTDEVVCEQVINRSIAVVIYAPSLHRETQPEYLSRVSSTAYALGFYSIPTIGVMVREAEFSKKVVVVSVKGDRNGEQFVELFEKKRKKYKIHVQSYIELEINDSLNTSLAVRFEEFTSNIVVLYATKPHAIMIFSAAEVTGKQKVWIVNEDASKASNVPDGAIASRLSQTPLSALRSSFASIKSSLEFLDSLDETVNPPSGCGKDAVHSKWATDHGLQLLRAICSTSTSKITFNERCERISVDYDILNYNEGYKEVGALNGAHLRLAEDSIHWTGGGRKPLEITLPKHLRAVTILDPPFIYTTPIISLAECKNLGTVSVELSPVNIVQVPNTTIDTSFTFSLHLNESYGAVTLGEKGYVLSGALGELDSDQADIAIGGMTINPEREKSVIPRDSPMQSFLQPLKSALWTSLLISVIMVGLVIFCLDLKSPFDRFYKMDKSQMAADDPFLMEVANDRVNFGEAMWFVWGVLLNSGVSEKTPRSCAARVLGIVWCGFCMIMVASYTANLAAFLVLDQPEKGLTGITDPRLRNPSANYSFGTVLNSNVYQYFKRHVELSTMFRKMEAHNMEKVSDAVASLMNGSLDAFIWDSTRLDFEAARQCELRTRLSTRIHPQRNDFRGALFGRSAYGVGLQKNSPWTPHITSAILRMAESGIMEKLDAKWIDNKESKCVTEAHKSPARLSLWNMKDIRKRELARSKQKIGDRVFLHPSPFVPDLNFGRHSVALFCSRCRNLVETDVHRECGLFAYVWCVIFVLLFLWPCSPLPCFMEAFADFVHICPVCSHKIGRYRRCRRPKFYV